MFIAEIDPSQIAVTSGMTSTLSIMQLVAGGDAVLSVPSAPLITGKILRVEVAGRLFSSAHTPTVQLYFGDSTSSPLNSAFSPASGTVRNFAWQYDFAYDSTSQLMIQPTNPQISSGAAAVSVASQTDIQFVLVTNSNVASDPSATATITRFRLMAI